MSRRIDPEDIEIKHGTCKNCEHFRLYAKAYDDGHGSEDWDDCGIGQCQDTEEDVTVDGECSRWAWNGD